MVTLHRTYLAALPVLGLSLALTACNTGGEAGNPAKPIVEESLPQASAEAICELVFECSCDDTEHVDEPACVEARSDELSEQQLAAQAAGLTYDAQCVGNLIALVEAAGCANILELESDCSSFCSPYHGNLPVDAACTDAATADGSTGWSDCAQGLWCTGGTCQDPCASESSDYLGLGDECRSPEGESLGNCDFTLGLFCDFETAVCVELPGVGEPCFGGEICGLGAVCSWGEGEATCVAIPGAGEACTYICDEGLYCDGVDGDEGTCNALPGAGQPCAPQNACAQGNSCNAELVCEPLPAWVCVVG